MYKSLCRYLIVLSLVTIQISLAQSPANEALATKWGLPDSPTGKASAFFLEAVNNKNHDYTRHFIETNFEPSFREALSMDEHLGMFARMYDDLADPELVSAQKTSQSSCTLTIRSKKTGRQFTAELKIEESAPFRITSISVAPFQVFEIVDSDTTNNNDDSRLTDITEFNQLVKVFNKDKGYVRLITLLSPT